MGLRETHHNARRILMPNYLDLPIGEEAPELFNTVIEIPLEGISKYEYDKELHVFRLDRNLYSPVHYPGRLRIYPEHVRRRRRSAGCAGAGGRSELSGMRVRRFVRLVCSTWSTRGSGTRRYSAWAKATRATRMSGIIPRSTRTCSRKLRTFSRSIRILKASAWKCGDGVMRRMPGRS